MKRRYLYPLYALTLIAFYVLGMAVRYTFEDSQLPPCVTEDSTGCYWDASESGNGLGVDVVTP